MVKRPGPAEKQPTHDYERVAGGDGCELGVCLPPETAPAAGERPPAYGSNDDLPADVREALPFPVQTLYREAYNQAWSRAMSPVRRGFTPRHDEAAARAAWRAVRRQYVQHGTTWVRRKPG